GPGRSRQLKSQHVLHAVKPRRLAGEPERGFHRAAREDAPAARAMGDLDLLALGGEDHAMLARIVAAAQGRKADIAALARSGDAVARALTMGGEVDAAAFGGGAAQRQG